MHFIYSSKQFSSLYIGHFIVSFQIHYNEYNTLIYDYITIKSKNSLIYLYKYNN